MDKIPVGLPFLDESEAEAASRAVLSLWVTQGPRVEAFEKAFSQYVGAPHACAVSNCTAALHLALKAVGVGPGDVVITVSHSFIATANAVRFCHAEPFFIDIDPSTLNMDPELLKRALETDFEERDSMLWLRDATRLAVGESPLLHLKPPVGRLGAILVAHQVGMPADMALITAVAGSYGVPVVEDAACAAGSEALVDEGRGWERIGRPHGEVACFSFHPRKLISTGEGGMLTTRNPEHDRAFRLLRQHGMSIPDSARHSAEEVVFEDYAVTGYNYKLTDIQAALGLEQLLKLDRMVEERRRLADIYASALSGIAGLKLPVEPGYARSNWQSYVVQLTEPARQKGVMQALLEQGISTRRGVMCSHLEAPYAGAWPAGVLPESTRARDSGIVLPFFNGMTEEQVKRVAAALKEALERG